MSMQTWLDEFYPVGYDHVYTTWEEALEICFLKWDGLKLDNLKNHELTTYGKDFRSLDGEIVHTTDSGFGAGMCGLCKLSDSIVKEQDRESCEVCPLAASRDGISCDDISCDDVTDDVTDDEFEESKDDSPWSMMYNYKTPEPMIEALKKTKIFMQEHVFNPKTLEWEPK